jgi:hypothetical protein
MEILLHNSKVIKTQTGGRGYYLGRERVEVGENATRSKTDRRRRKGEDLTYRKRFERRRLDRHFHRRTGAVAAAAVVIATTATGRRRSQDKRLRNDNG